MPSASARGLARPLGPAVGASALAWLGAAFGSLVLTLAVGTEERMPVILPILAATGSAGAFGWPPAFYLADVLALVPQQLLPIEKISPSVWYVNTFYPIYAAMGGGFVFGSITESVLGGGWVDAVGRGAALGLLMAQIHRHHARGGGKFWSFIFYTWATVSAYQSFRATTFVLAGYAVYRFLPMAIGVSLLASVLRAMPRRTGP